MYESGVSSPLSGLSGVSVVLDVDATVVDLCPSCEGYHIDLSPGAFTQLASQDTGLIQVYWNWE